MKGIRPQVAPPSRPASGQREKRERDRVGRSDRQGVDVETWGFSIIGSTETDFGLLTYGGDA